MTVCVMQTKRLMKMKDARAFLTPVDPIADNCSDYLTVIQRPMCLNDVLHRLQNGSYAHAHEFAADVRLTFENAKTYNANKHPVHAAARRLLKTFDDHFAKLQLPRPSPSAAPHACSLISVVGADALPPSACARGVFRSRFRVAPPTADDVVAQPDVHRSDALVSSDLRTLNHRAEGATHWRARRADQYIWAYSAWHDISDVAFESAAGVPTVVQYYADGSAAYVVAGCRGADGQPCPVSFYSSMYTRDGDWGPAAPMRRRPPDRWSRPADPRTAPRREHARTRSPRRSHGPR